MRTTRNCGMRVSSWAGSRVLAEACGGLHTGAVCVDDDFDELLPDTFWLGEEQTCGCNLALQ